MEQDYLSIKQIAEKLGTSKQRVYRCIKKNHINESHSEVVNGNTVFIYDSKAYTRIKEYLNNGSCPSREAHQDVHQEAVYESLLKQLEAKDKQIEALSKALDQSQQLHAMDKQKLLALEDKMQEQQEPEKKKWWQKLLR